MRKYIKIVRKAHTIIVNCQFSIVNCLSYVSKINKNLERGMELDSLCESCWNYDYDEEFDEYFCMMDLDEDEIYRYLISKQTRCPFYRQGDDYTLARKQ